MQMHVKIVCEGFNCKAREILDQVNAPAIPDMVTMTLMSASKEEFIPNSVFAKSIAVPETVATASLIMNHAARKSNTSLSRRARMIVFPKFLQEYEM